VLCILFIDNRQIAADKFHAKMNIDLDSEQARIALPECMHRIPWSQGRPYLKQANDEKD
jgi:hypothetical protein